MKTLILMRHAKAGWGDGAVTDIDRPLTDLGQTQARACATWLSSVERPRPDHILVSPSRRTRETWEALARAWPGQTPVFLDRLYHAGAEGILAAIARHGRGAGCVLVIGHNPGIAELAGSLAGGTPPQALNHFKPATIAVFTCDINDWSQLPRTPVSLSDHFVPPK